MGRLDPMSFFQKYRLWIAGAIVVVVGILLLILGYQTFKPIPESTSFKTRFYSFSYPRIYSAQEYAPGVVSIGNKKEDGIDPLVEVTRYQSDPDTAVPTTFDAFMKRQAAALCGADGSIESITCTEIGVTPYTSPTGVEGKKLSLTLVRKNLKTGTTTPLTYSPIYVFNTSLPRATSTQSVSSTTEPYRYSAIFIYPSLTSFIAGTTSPQVMDPIINSFVLTNS